MVQANDLLTRGVEEIIERESLEKKLKSGKKLRVKFGIDPTAPDLHLGHTVPLRKLKQFQDLGNNVVLIIGDFTATVGDPSARKEARKPLKREEVERNMKTYLDQIGKILDLKKTEVRRNSQWYDKKNTLFLFELSSKVTVQRVLERDDFKKRLLEDRDINMLEIIYPLLQGYDSVCIKSDLEIGGMDQKFNLLMGRRIQKRYGQKPQDIMLLSLLEGTDGIRKMSKSFKNYIGITEEPEEIYGKIMSLPDSLISPYFELCTDFPQDEVKKIKNKRDQKARLAFEIVKIYHGETKAKKAEEEFNRVFKEKLYPSETPEVSLHGLWHLVDLLLNLKMVKSKSEAKRVIEQGGVKIDGRTEMDRFATFEVKDGMIIQVGKRRFVKIKSQK